MRANQELNLTADKKEQAKAISKTQKPMARGEEESSKEIERDTNKEVDKISNIC